MSRRVVMYFFVVTVFCGCRTWPWREGAVPESVANCRELSQQAITCMDTNRWEQAEALLNRAVASCGIDPYARRHYADVLMRRGATHEAIGQLEEAIRLTPHDTTLVVRAGEMYLQAGRVVEAQQRANDAINLDVKSADAWALRGRIQLSQGNHREALTDFQRAIGYRPEDPRLLNEVASLYMALNQPARALLYLQNLSDAYVVGEEPVDLIVRQGEALAAMGRVQDAAANFRLACAREPASADMFYRLGQLEFQAGRIEPARAAMENALRLQPGHAESRQLLARLPGLVRASNTYR